MAWACREDNLPRVSASQGNRYGFEHETCVNILSAQYVKSRIKGRTWIAHSPSNSMERPDLRNQQLPPARAYLWTKITLILTSTTAKDIHQVMVGNGHCLSVGALCG